MADPFREQEVTHVLGIEARGFILGGAVATSLGAGFVPARKPGKLPWERVTESYDLEYGKDALECHRDGLPAPARVLIVDDVLATGGTARAAGQLARAPRGRSGRVELPAGDRGAGRPGEALRGRRPRRGPALSRGRRGDFRGVVPGVTIPAGRHAGATADLRALHEVGR